MEHVCSKALFKEAGLPSPSTRVKLLVTIKVSWFKRLSDDNPTRLVFERASNLKLT